MARAASSSAAPTMKRDMRLDVGTVSQLGEAQTWGER
jgi:hypothetical protein